MRNCSSFWNSHLPIGSPRSLSPRKLPRQARSEATVEAIFEATIQVLVAHGISRLTTTRVAERAGVSIGTMYQYFPHKEALVRAIVGRYLERVAAAVEQCCVVNTGQPLSIASDALVAAYIDAKGEDANASRALYAASSELDVADLVTATFRRLRSATSQLLQACPDIRVDDLDDVAFSLVASLTGATRIVFEHDLAPGSLDAFRQRMKAMARAFLIDAARSGNYA